MVKFLVFLQIKDTDLFFAVDFAHGLILDSLPTAAKYWDSVNCTLQIMYLQSVQS
jgi:hypothetical protein